MFSKIRNLFAHTLKVDVAGDPRDFARDVALGARLPQDVHDAIGMVPIAADVAVEHRPELPREPGVGTTIVVKGPRCGFAIPVPYGATKWRIADAIHDAIDNFAGLPDPEPEVLPFPEPAPVAG